jgi:hypothetical protein
LKRQEKRHLPIPAEITAVSAKRLRQQQAAIQDEGQFSAGGSARTVLTAKFDGRRADASTSTLFAKVTDREVPENVDDQAVLNDHSSLASPANSTSDHHCDEEEELPYDAVPPMHSQLMAFSEYVAQGAELYGHKSQHILKALTHFIYEEGMDVQHIASLNHATLVALGHNLRLGITAAEVALHMRVGMILAEMAWKWLEEQGSEESKKGDANLYEVLSPSAAANLDMRQDNT